MQQYSQASSMWIIFVENLVVYALKLEENLKIVVACT